MRFDESGHQQVAATILARVVAGSDASDPAVLDPQVGRPGMAPGPDVLQHHVTVPARTEGHSGPA